MLVFFPALTPERVCFYFAAQFYCCNKAISIDNIDVIMSA